MSPPPPLLISLQKAIARRVTDGLPVFRVDEPHPSYAPDLFSNDYLSLSADHVLRDNFLRKVQAAPPARLFGSTGTRALTGNFAEIIALERALKYFFRSSSSSALIFGSGFNANLAFLATVPQKDDVIVYDELIHASCREGIRGSSRPSYRFAHNSVASLEERLLSVLQEHPQITQGISTVFVVLESLYSMDGDFCPLTEIVGLVERLVPVGHAHIVVDEAHTSGICGPDGAGYVSHLGLDDRVHTKVHPLSKGWGYHGGVVVTSPMIREYLYNFGKSVLFSTSIPFTDIYALESCLDLISSARGRELRQRLDYLTRYARKELFTALKNIPETILAVNIPESEMADSDQGLCSPIIPVFTPFVMRLTDHLRQKGYAVTPLTYPFVKRPRIRISIHAGNTESEIDALVRELLTWAAQQEVLPTARTSSSTAAGAGESHVKAK